MFDKIEVSKEFQRGLVMIDYTHRFQDRLLFNLSFFFSNLTLFKKFTNWEEAVLLKFIAILDHDFDFLLPVLLQGQDYLIGFDSVYLFYK